MKIIRVLARWFVVLCVPLLLLSATIGAAFNSIWIYTSGFDKYDVAAELEISDAELKHFAQELIVYFNNTHQEYLSIDVTYDNGQTGPLYNQADIRHMRDVKNLLWLDYYVFAASALYIMLYMVVRLVGAYSKFISEVAQRVWNGGLLTLGILFFVGFFAATDFKQFFSVFHEIAFLGGNYTFSVYDPMTIMFPDGFWSDVALLVGVAGVALGLLMTGIGWLILKLVYRRKTVVY